VRGAGYPPARQAGVVTGALAGAGEVGCAAGLVRQRIDGAAGQQEWTVTPMACRTGQRDVS